MTLSRYECKIFEVMGIMSFIMHNNKTATSKDGHLQNDIKHTMKVWPDQISECLKGAETTET